MNAQQPPQDAMDRRERIGKILVRAAPVVVLLLLALLIWKFASDTVGAKRQIPEPPMIALAPPPPPPPPPPKEKPPEPQKTVETPQPTPTPQPKTNTPAKSDAPKQLTINGPAQAGTDAFGVAAGNGGGVSVGGDPNGSDTPGGGDFGEANYSRYLKSTLQQAVQADEKVNRLFFAAQVDVWIGADGRISRVAVVQSSGDPRTDRALVDALQQIGRLDQPPAQLRFPARIALRGRRT